MDEFTDVTQWWLKELGDFDLTKENSGFEMIGYVIEEYGEEYIHVPWYMSIDDWRELANACHEIADYLEAKNEQAALASAGGE